MITIFCHPRPWNPPFDVIQRNCIESAARTFDQVIVLGKDARPAPSGLRVTEGIEYKFDHFPTLPSMFATADAHSSGDIKCYSTCDLIYPHDFSTVVHEVAREFDTFLIVGRRTDLRVDYSIDFSSGDWWERLSVEDGRLHSPCGIDYFVWRGRIWLEMKPFVFHVLSDNWLLGEALRRDIPVIDVTRCATVIHQSHPTTKNVNNKPRAWNFDQVCGAEMNMGRDLYEMDNVAHIGQCKIKMTVESNFE